MQRNIPIPAAVDIVLLLAIRSRLIRVRIKRNSIVSPVNGHPTRPSPPHFLVFNRQCPGVEPALSSHTPLGHSRARMQLRR